MSALPRFFVYAVYRDDACIYIGKGQRDRHLQSKHQHGGNRVEILERFDDEWRALAREHNLIQEVRPERNSIEAPYHGRKSTKPVRNPGEDYYQHRERLLRENLTGLTEVRGIMLRPADHDTIRDAAEKLREEREDDK